MLEAKILKESPAVLVEMEGQLNMALRKEALMVGFAELKRHHLKGLIVDVSNTSFAPFEVRIDAMELISYLRVLGMHAGMKLALIHPEPDERRKYFAQKSKTFSFQVEYFSSLEEAEPWIKDGI